MSLTISDEFLEAGRLSEVERRLEIAALLFEKEKLTLGQASRFAQQPVLRFSRLLASRGIEVHYGTQDLEGDLQTLSDLDRG